MTALSSVADRLALIELNSSYAHAVSTHDLALFMSLWGDDATWTHPYFGTLEGTQAIKETVGQAMDAYPLLVFTCQLTSLEINGGGAKGTVFVSELTGKSDGTKERVTGRYDDTYVKAGETWCFQSREYAILDVSSSN